MPSPANPGGEHTFCTTHWSDVMKAGDQASPPGLEALTRLCQTYWFPIYAFIRKRGFTPEESQDLTQEFFHRFLERNQVVKAVRARGRFRSFLMASVQNFLHNVRDHNRAQKRGGGLHPVSLDDQTAEERYLREPSDSTDPARTFEQQWAATLLELVFSQLRNEYAQRGQETLFEALQGHLWGDDDPVSYAELARRQGMSLANIKVIAHRLRARYRELLRAEIARTVSEPGEVDAEIRHLMKVVSE